MNLRLAVLTAPLLFGGCELVDDGRDLIGDLTNPLVTQALVLGVTPPSEASEVELPDEYSEGAGATVFLADAADVANLEDAPISGAQVDLQGESVAELTAGSYGLQPGALAYEPDGAWTLSVMLGGDTATAVIDLPPAASFELPETHQPNQAITVDLTGQGFDSALVVVIDDSGTVVYDNRPTDIRGLYDLTRGDQATTVTIEAEAFPRVGAYVVGVAGIRTTTGREDIDGMNTALSTMMAGNMVMEPLVVAP